MVWLKKHGEYHRIQRNGVIYVMIWKFQMAITPNSDFGVKSFCRKETCRRPLTPVTNEKDVPIYLEWWVGIDFFFLISLDPDSFDALDVDIEKQEPIHDIPIHIPPHHIPPLLIDVRFRDTPLRRDSLLGCGRSLIDLFFLQEMAIPFFFMWLLLFFLFRSDRRRKIVFSHFSGFYELVKGWVFKIFTFFVKIGGTL